MTTFGPYPAVVVAVHDGDTITVDVLLRASRSHRPDRDLGFQVHARPDGLWLVGQHVRIQGINAPELATPAGVAAAEYLRKLVPLGTRAALTSSGWDKYGGRIDGRVVLADGTDLAQALVASGHAAPWDGKGPKPVPASPSS